MQIEEVNKVSDQRKQRCPFWGADHEVEIEKSVCICVSE